MWTLLPFQHISERWCLPATPYSPRVPPNETGSPSCTAAKTAKERGTCSLSQCRFDPRDSPQIMCVSSFKTYLIQQTHAGVKWTCELMWFCATIDFETFSWSFVKQKSRRNELSVHLRGRRRGLVEEKWGLSTSRTGIPLQGHETVTVTLGQHDTECCTTVGNHSAWHSKQFDKRQLLPTSARLNADLNSCLHFSPLPPFSPTLCRKWLKGSNDWNDCHQK